MPADEKQFTDLVTGHARHVVAGNLRAAAADFAPDRIPQLFEGVQLTGAQVSAYEIRSISTEPTGPYTAEIVYTTPDGLVGLRSAWEDRGGTLKIAALANFRPETEDV